MAYTKLSYIQSTGTQYIDTGYIANNNTKVEIAVSVKMLNSSYLFGARDTWLVNDYSLTNNTDYIFQYTSDGVLSTGIYPSVYNVDVIETNIPHITVNGTVFTGETVQDYSCNYNLYVFAINNAGTAYKFAEMQLFYMKIWDNGSLVKDFIPVLDENNVVCLYDKVSGTYYYNAGSGDFTPGYKVVPTITIGTPSRDKISAISGYDQSVVDFRSDIGLIKWEARATLPGVETGHGVGLLVESGDTLEINTDATVYIDDEELTNGDNNYTITVHGLNVYNHWSDGSYEQFNLFDYAKASYERCSLDRGVITFDTGTANTNPTAFLKIQTWADYSYVSQIFEAYTTGSKEYILTKTSDFSRLRIALHGDNTDASIYFFVPFMQDGLTYSISFKLSELRTNYAVIQNLIIKEVAE